MTRRPLAFGLDSGRLLALLADSGPVLVLALIAAAGSFTHIRDTAVEHGQRGWMAWAVAVCIDLTCVMAARERQRDKKTGRRASGFSWPTLVLAGGVLLSLAANLAQAQATAWGWIVAGTPAAAFLVAVSMLERRAGNSRVDRPATSPAPSSASSSASLPVPPSFGRPDAPSPTPAVSSSSLATPSVSAPAASVRPAAQATPPTDADEQLKIPNAEPAKTDNSNEQTAPAPPLVEFARRVAAEHQSQHGRPITRDALRARLGVSNQLASDLLRQVRDHVPA